MVMPESYDALVDAFARKLKEAKGNVESKVMTPSETAKEIAEITEGAFNAPMPNFEAIGQLGQKPIENQPKRRGRPRGSKNKPKQ